MVQCANCGVLPREPLSAWPWNGKSHYLGAVEIPKLATYLGHVHVNETYWYLEAVPELLELATRRLESTKETEP